MEFLQQRYTDNSSENVETLEKLEARLGRIRPGKTNIIQHVNARPHTSRETRKCWTGLDLRLCDLTPSDFYPFPKVMGDVRTWCREKLAEFYADSVQQLPKGGASAFNGGVPTFLRGCVPPLLEVARHVGSPSLTLPSSRSCALSWLPLGYSLCPSIIIQSGYMPRPFPLLFQYKLDYVLHSCSLSYFCVWDFIFYI